MNTTTHTELPQVLILTDVRDEHANHVTMRLTERRISFSRVDPGCFPSSMQISASFVPGTPLRTTLQTVDRTIDLSAVHTIWYRRPSPPMGAMDLGDAAVRECVEEEARQFVRDLWDTIDCAWIPAPPSVLRVAGEKMRQLKIATEMGFRIPPTLVSNSPGEVVRFYQEFGGQIISKLLGTAFVTSDLGIRYSRYTQIVSPRDIAYVNAVSICPMIFQAYVPKRLELRVTVVGDRVFAAEIHSQETTRTRHDWRRYDLEHTRHAPHVLPEDLEERCRALVRRLGLVYGTIDLILTPEGEYVFLEINPNGQYLWIEGLIGLPITDALIELLIKEVPHGH